MRGPLSNFLATPTISGYQGYQLRNRRGGRFSPERRGSPIAFLEIVKLSFCKRKTLRAAKLTERQKMNDVEGRLARAQWVLERNLAWIAAAEVKVGVVVAIDVAMLGGLGAAFSGAKVVPAWGYVFSFLAAIALASGLITAAMAVLPRLTGPKNSVVFFGCIAKEESADYRDRFRNVSDLELLDDWTTQIHRNAEIALEKFAWVKSAMWWSFLSVLPWFGAIYLLVQK